MQLHPAAVARARQAVAEHLDRAAALRQLQELIRIQTENPPGNEAPAAAYLAGLMRRIGLETEVETVAPGRANAVGRVRGDGRRPALLFSGHTDTVPAGANGWHRDPCAGEIAGRRLYGRGAADMKGGLLALVLAAGLVARVSGALAGDLVVAATADEESDSIGARQFAARCGAGSVGGVVVAEPTGMELAIAEKGALWLRVEAKGRAAHSAMPHLGVNAIEPVLATLAHLRSLPMPGPHPLLGAPVLTVTTLVGGVKTNMIPDQCTATVDIRTVPGQGHPALVAAMQHWLGAARAGFPGAEVQVRVVNDRPAVDTAPDHPFVQTAAAVLADLQGAPVRLRGMGYYTDACVFSPDGAVPFVICGPGEPEQAHQADEWLDLDKFYDAITFYAALALAWLEG